MRTTNTCDFCCKGSTPLFRITNKYDYGESIDLTGECEKCSSDPDSDECYACDSKPYQPENTINITVKITDDKLTFDDKCNKEDPYTVYFDINYCPMCGRELGERGE